MEVFLEFFEVELFCDLDELIAEVSDQELVEEREIGVIWVLDVAHSPGVLSPENIDVGSCLDMAYTGNHEEGRAWAIGAIVELVDENFREI